MDFISGGARRSEFGVNADILESKICQVSLGVDWINPHMSYGSEVRPGDPRRS